jgi:hypothetical protein
LVDVIATTDKGRAVAYRAAQRRFGRTRRLVTSRWEEIKKRRTLELETLARFYSLYGEFFAVWKLWSVHKKSRYLAHHERDSKAVWELLRRAAEVEGGFEAILVRLTQERVLSRSQVTDLARFREAYQCLRQAIRSDRTLDWWNKEHGDSGHAQYTAFKDLASGVASILSTEPGRVVRRPVRPSPDAAMRNLTAATDSSRFRNSWWVAPRPGENESRPLARDGGSA